MAAVDDLIAASDKVAAILLAIETARLTGDWSSTTIPAGAKPNASGPEMVDHQGYYNNLRAALKDYNEQIAAARGPTVTRRIGVIG